MGGAPFGHVQHARGIRPRGDVQREPGPPAVRGVENGHVAGVAPSVHVAGVAPSVHVAMHADGDSGGVEPRADGDADGVPHNGDARGDDAGGAVSTDVGGGVGAGATRRLVIAAIVLKLIAMPALCMPLTTLAVRHGVLADDPVCAQSDIILILL